jgi:multiple sugar transport system permease protein
MKSGKVDWSAYGFVAPAVLILAVVHIYPILWLIVLSGQETDVLRNTHEWTGLANYKTLFEDPIFWKSAKNTVIYCLWVVPGVLVISLALAFACQPMRDRAQHAMRAALYLPGVVSVVVLGMVWARIYDPQFGLINRALALAGVEGPVWLGDTTWALLAISMMSVFSGLGTSFILCTTAIQAVPREYYEAGEIDGANAVRTFFAITMPLIRPTLLYLVIILTVGSFQVFAAVFVMTDGGPNFATSTIVYLVYELAFRYFDFGTASATSVLLLVGLIVLAMVQFKTLSTDVEY